MEKQGVRPAFPPDNLEAMDEIPFFFTGSDCKLTAIRSYCTIPTAGTYGSSYPADTAGSVWCSMTAAWPMGWMLPHRCWPTCSICSMRIHTAGGAKKSCPQKRVLCGHICWMGCRITASLPPCTICAGGEDGAAMEAARTVRQALFRSGTRYRPGGGQAALPVLERLTRRHDTAAERLYHLVAGRTGRSGQDTGGAPRCRRDGKHGGADTGRGPE